METASHRENLVALCFTDFGGSYATPAARQRATRQLRALERLLPSDPKLRAILLSGVTCVAAEPTRLIVVHRVVSSGEDTFFPVTHATVQVWNLLAFSGGFEAILHQYGEAAFTAELHGVEREKLVSAEQGEAVLKAFVAGGFLQMTPFMAVAEADTE